jgi:NAD(P) transhydrogenase subunit alpha
MDRKDWISMKIGIPKEVKSGEKRVALVPALVNHLKKQNHEVLIETGAGSLAYFPDALFAEHGALLVPDAESLYAQAEVIFKIQPPQFHPVTGKHEAEMLREGTVYLGFMSPYNNLDTVAMIAKRKITSFALEFIPRIARAQNMDALSAMATIAGYKAVLMAANRLGKMFPLMMTAAGTITPASVLVLGAGVAGLEAIATAKRLGARVEAFDPRPVVREQVKSVGASFIDMELPEEAEGTGGYAKEQSIDFLNREREVIGSWLPRTDVVITTAQVFGKRAPLLITAEMVMQLKPGSVIVDLAAEQGGNCELTVPGSTIESNGVLIIGELNIPSAIPEDASLLYSHNILNLFEYLYPANKAAPELTDEIVRATCITRDGEITNEQIKKLMLQGAQV